jgi:hypothetical protein
MSITKEQLFEKYYVNETHAEWYDQIDNWISVEIFKIMHDGRLPVADDISLKYIIDFANKLQDQKEVKSLRDRKDFGSLYLTTKRMIYRYIDPILLELNGN